MTSVIKIGGISFDNSQLYSDMKFLANKNSDNIFIIISALKNVSSMLKQSAESAEIGKKNDYVECINKISAIHKNFIETNIVAKGDKLSILISEFEEYMLKILNSVAMTGFLSKRILDHILSQGEILLFEIIKLDMQDFKSIDFIDARDIIKTNNNYNSAEPLLEMSYDLINQKVSASGSKLFITQGFVGSDQDGNTTTMGFESSNLTALLIAQALGSKEIRIVTDVEGIYNADPKLFTKSSIINEINYDDAFIAAKYGLKLFYAPMIESARLTGTKIIYTDKINDSKELTILSDTAEYRKSLIIFKEVVQLNDMSAIDIDGNSSSIMHISDKMTNCHVFDSRFIKNYNVNSLIYFNHICILTFLFCEQDLIISNAVKIFEGNENFKLTIMNKDIIHILADVESGKAFCEKILPMLS